MLGFFLKLLYPVLAEEALAGGVGLEDDLDRMDFADCHQSYFAVGAVGSATGFVDLLLQMFEVPGDGHALCILSFSFPFDCMEIETNYVDHFFTDRLEHLYDLCLVWAPEV